MIFLATILPYFITAILTIVSGMILFLIQRFFNDHQQKEQRRVEEQAKDNALILRSIKALGNLTVANSIALRDGKTNGEMKSALAEYETIEKEMYDYIVSYYSKSVTNNK